MARKKKHKAHEEHPSEAWLLPYSDLLTLLLALFIVLFAVSQTDQKKVTEMAQSDHFFLQTLKNTLSRSVEQKLLMVLNPMMFLLTINMKATRRKRKSYYVPTTKMPVLILATFTIGQRKALRLLK